MTLRLWTHLNSAALLASDLRPADAAVLIAASAAELRAGT